MVSVGVIPSLVIGLREGIEAALIIGILLAYLTKIGQKSLRRYILYGTGAAVAANLVILVALFAVSFQMEEGAAKAFEGFATLLAVVVLTSMVFWMLKAAQNLKKEFEQRIDTLVDRRQLLGLSTLAFIAVFREGIETVLLTSGQAALSSPSDAVTGVLGGILIASVIGFGIFLLSWKIDLKRFFQVTSAFLIIIAAGLFAYSVHELNEAYFPAVNAEVYNTKAILPDKIPEDGSDFGAGHVVGALLRGVVGYNDNPRYPEAIAYLAYWVFVVLLYVGVRSGKIEILVRPLRNALRFLFGSRSLEANRRSTPPTS